MKTSELVQTLNAFLEIEKFKDYAPNGLQIEGSLDTQRVVCGVSASLELIERAIELEAQTIIVHHGYFWKNEDPRITGVKKKRITKLLCNDINLLGYHLPLDSHPVLGNNVLLGKRLGVKEVCQLENSPFALKGRFEVPMTVEELGKKLASVLNRVPLTIASSLDEPIETVAWCTGAAQDDLQIAAQEGAQAFISGEISERTVWESRELNVPYFCAGHYATETLGISELAVWLRERFPGLSVTFVDLDNPV